MTHERLAGKTILITGGARGMGASHAELLAQHGGNVIIADVLTVEAKALADQLQDRGLNCSYVALDVTNEDDWAAAVRTADETFGGLDVLVNNAGVTGTPGGFATEDPTTWRTTIDINQTGAYLGLRAVVPSMRQRGSGSIINISSILGFVGDPDYFAYNASKGALRTMTRSAALKLAEHRIRVNTVCPGMVRTPMNEHEVDADSYVDATPLKRMAEPVEVSYAVLFLASDESSYVTGTDLIVDGGYLA